MHHFSSFFLQHSLLNIPLQAAVVKPFPVRQKMLKPGLGLSASPPASGSRLVLAGWPQPSAFARQVAWPLVRGRASPPIRCGAPLQTPHSGYHLDGTGRRFFEGWYFKVTLPGPGQAFAFMYSIEDPPVSVPPVALLPGGDQTMLKRPGVGAQVMGPDDGYIVHYTSDARRFWASPHLLELGCVFPGANRNGRSNVAFERGSSQKMVGEPEFWAQTEGSSGFQVSATWHQGSLTAAEVGLGKGPTSTVETVRWAYSVRPLTGWGNSNGTQRATAGWLAALPVFEPHWQVLMALGAATGYIEWAGRRYEFVDAPAYAEKNWGGSFPTKWFWIQCNTFDGHPSLALTAGGGVRGIPLLSRQENVAMIGVHYEGHFIELAPWLGQVTWDIAQWSSWRMTGATDSYEAELHATCAPGDGAVLRAPTAASGLAAACRDTFFGQATLTVWRRSGGIRMQPPLIDRAHSSGAALEVGGGPWWAPWSGQARMEEPLRSALNLPVDLDAVLAALPQALQPPGF